MKDGFESLGRLRLQAILLLAGVFVIGALGGAAIERLRAVCDRRPPPISAPDRLPPELEQELQLTPEQVRQIAEIFARRQTRTETVLADCYPKLRAIADSGRTEIRALLTPEQQQILDSHRPPEGAPPPEKRMLFDPQHRDRDRGHQHPGGHPVGPPGGR